MLSRALTIVREPDRLVLHAEDCVIVLEQAPTDKVQPVDRVDERLARLRLPRERPHVQLAARDRQVERLARRVRERQRQLRGKICDLRARDPVRGAVLCRLWRVRFDVRGDVRVDCLCGSTVSSM